MESTSYMIHVPKPLWRRLKSRVALSGHKTINDVIVSLVSDYAGPADGFYEEVGLYHSQLMQSESNEVSNDD